MNISFRTQADIKNVLKELAGQVQVSVRINQKKTSETAETLVIVAYRNIIVYTTDHERNKAVRDTVAEIFITAGWTWQAGELWWSLNSGINRFSTVSQAVSEALSTTLKSLNGRETISDVRLKQYGNHSQITFKYQ